MPYLIGTDEAGYGPNLGPLVIAATVWKIPESAGVDLYELLAPVVSRDASPPEDSAALAIADSKSLYKPGGGLRQLERAVLAGLQICGRSAKRWRDIWPALACGCEQHMNRIPWYESYDAPLPLDVAADEVDSVARRLRGKLRETGIDLVNVSARVIFPQQFNRLVRQHGNKAAVLSAVTLALVEAAVTRRADDSMLIVCDKHGGRNKYGPLLQQTFPERLVEVCRESRAKSVYRWGPPGRRIEIRFVAKGEGFLPAALASMSAKYLRELAMRALNDFWCCRVANLRPTAGYPVDARRFRADVRETQVKLGIDDDVLWRER